MAKEGDHRHSYLFTVRMWPEELGDGRVEWRGQVEHVIGGETAFFRRWSDLNEFMRVRLPDVKASQMSRPDD